MAIKARINDNECLEAPKEIGPERMAIKIIDSISGHLVIENSPTTFKYPTWFFIGSVLI